MEKTRKFYEEAIGLPLLPGGLRAVGPLSPGFWAMRSYRAALAESSTSSLLGSMAGLACFIALGVVLNRVARAASDGRLSEM